MALSSSFMASTSTLQIRASISAVAYTHLNQGGRDMGLQVGGELFKTSVDDYFLEYRVGVYRCV